ncbi:hypothetical protein BJ742DRAFT_850873 [Cladochytrium replicatum]|nr:hypothetical protein BJ742DRAFT_850873 [Cladochytrium replicatum]
MDDRESMRPNGEKKDVPVTETTSSERVHTTDWDRGLVRSTEYSAPVVTWSREWEEKAKTDLMDLLNQTYIIRVDDISHDYDPEVMALRAAREAVRASRILTTPTTNFGKFAVPQFPTEVVGVATLDAADGALLAGTVLLGDVHPPPVTANQLQTSLSWHSSMYALTFAFEVEASLVDDVVADGYVDRVGSNALRRGTGYVSPPM